jgi:hypothetical protein
MDIILHLSQTRPLKSKERTMCGLQLGLFLSLPKESIVTRRPQITLCTTVYWNAILNSTLKTFLLYTLFKKRMHSKFLRYLFFLYLSFNFFHQKCKKLKNTHGFDTVPLQVFISVQCTLRYQSVPVKKRTQHFFSEFCVVQRSSPVPIFSYFFNTASSAAHRFRCVGGCWDQTQDSCYFCIVCYTLSMLG